MERPRVKVVNPNESWMGTEYYIDGKKINNVRSVDFRVAVDEFPQFTFETTGVPDIDMAGDIRFRFTPETVKQAAVVLQNELMTNKDYRDTFLKSMYEFWQTRVTCEDIQYDDFKEAAELMLNCLIGMEKERK